MLWLWKHHDTGVNILTSTFRVWNKFPSQTCEKPCHRNQREFYVPFGLTRLCDLEHLVRLYLSTLQLFTLLSTAESQKILVTCSKPWEILCQGSELKLPFPEPQLVWKASGSSKLTGSEQATTQFYHSVRFNTYSFQYSFGKKQNERKQESKWAGGGQTNDYISQRLLVTRANLLIPGRITEVSLWH